MTNAETLALAFLRQEYQITPCQSRVLLALWQARRPLTAVDLLARAQLPTLTTLRAHLSHLRHVVTLPREVGGRNIVGLYALADESRTEITDLLASAAAGLAELTKSPPARLHPTRAA